MAIPPSSRPAISARVSPKTILRIGEPLILDSSRTPRAPTGSAGSRERGRPTSRSAAPASRVRSCSGIVNRQAERYLSPSMSSDFHPMFSTA